jgi:hypothetical protein
MTIKTNKTKPVSKQGHTPLSLTELSEHVTLRNQNFRMGAESKLKDDF